MSKRNKIPPKKIIGTNGDVHHTPSELLINDKFLKRNINVLVKDVEITTTAKKKASTPAKTVVKANTKEVAVTKKQATPVKKVEVKKETSSKVVTLKNEEVISKTKKMKKAKKTLSMKVFNKPKKSKNKTNIFSEPAKIENTGEHIAEIKNLRLGFTSKTSKQYKEIIRGVDLKIYPGEVLGILGESGSGKTVLTSAMLGILGDNVVVKGGQVLLGGVDVANWNQKQWDKSGFRGPIITSVFQNPMKTLNPVRTIQDQFIETLAVNNRAENKKEAIELSKDYLRTTQIKNVDQVMASYAHELSGGMIQRVVIAMALATEAQIIVMDEPTTALDPVVQAEIINLIIDIKEQFNTAFIFISHDIGVIGTVSDKIAVLYAGRVAEYGSTEEIIWNPKHPYTWNLLMAMPDLNQGTELFTIPGSVPADSTNSRYEVFAPRNEYALGIDFNEESPKHEISKTHFVYSNLYSKEVGKFNPPKLIEDRWNKFKSRKKGNK